MDNNTGAFLELVKAGLWENCSEFQVSQDSQARMSDQRSSASSRFQDSIDWEKVYQLAEEQSVIGVALAGIEHSAVKPSQELLLQWIGEVQILEQQNMAMNQFVAELIEKLRRTDIYTLLVKGQGVAQCYVRPLWRACGDVDLLLSAENYEKAKGGLTPLADHVDPENKEKRHLGLSIGDWIVELHGTMHVEMSRRMNKGIDAVQNDCFYGGNVRSWDNNGTTIFLPSPDNDVILVFTHILEHFFIEGVGLKQVCDWCRLLYTYRDSLNYGLLEKRIRKMELVTEWKVFGALAVDELGMPKEAMPMYESRFHQRGQRVLSRIMKSGNMGHNNDLSYRSKYSGLTYKLVALWRRMKDFAGFTKIFPIDAPKFFIHYVFRKI